MLVGKRSVHVWPDVRSFLRCPPKLLDQKTKIGTTCKAKCAGDEYEAQDLDIVCDTKIKFTKVCKKKGGGTAAKAGAK